MSKSMFSHAMMSSLALVAIQLAHAQVTTPYVERFEQVAHDGNDTNVSNHWGGHQPRVTVHNDGSVRLLYLQPATNGYTWRVMKRSAAATPDWIQEASGFSTDDAMMVRDPNTDGVYVVAWPNSVPTVYALPTGTSTVIPGIWQNLTWNSRHYSGTGIGPDGTLCLKTSVELATTTQTNNTETVYECGKFNAASRSWSWNPQVTQWIGLRHAYDLLFPGGFGNNAQLVATAQYDLYKDAAGCPYCNTANTYVFNGVRFYTTGVANASSWFQADTVVPYPIPSGATTAPFVRPFDTYVDTNHRVWTGYVVSNPENGTSPGIYLVVSDLSANILYKAQLTALPQYTSGRFRIFQDSKGRFWLLYTNQGSQATQVFLYPVTVSGTTSLYVQVGAKTDLSNAFVPYSILGTMLLAVPRGGQAIGNSVNAEMVACDGTYVSGQSLNCSPNGSNLQRIFHVRIRLPD